MVFEEGRFAKAAEAIKCISEVEEILTDLKNSRLRGGYEFPEKVDTYLKASKIMLREAKKIRKLIYE